MTKMTFQEESDGLTMPGGSASNTLATQTSLTSIFPTFRQLGAYGIISSLMAKGRSVNASRPLVFTGQEGHYSIEKAAMACGLGLDSVVAVPCNEDGTMDTAALEDMMDNAFKDSQGQSTPSGFPFFVNATAGSTVMGAFDALNKVADVCHKLSDRYSTTIWMHVDASWGGPVLFSQKHRSRMAGVERFDSLTICPHKLMNIPHQCSFALFRRGETLDCNTLDAPYLYHDSSSNGNIRQLDKRGIKAARKSLRREAPSKAAFGCGRRGDALKLYLAWLSKGSRFFSDQVDQAIVLAQKIYTLIKTDPHLDSRLEITSRHTSKDGLYAQICFRPRLKQLSQMRRVDAEDRSKSTRHVHALLQKQQRFAVDFAPVGGNEGDFIRMITHPGTSLEKLVDLVHQIAVMGNEYDRERSRAT
jgi:glutamate decarboxylase